MAKVALAVALAGCSLAVQPPRHRKEGFAPGRMPVQAGAFDGGRASVSMPPSFNVVGSEGGKEGSGRGLRQVLLLPSPHLLSSTAYCLRGRMASGRNTYVGAVAANRYPLGTHLHLRNELIDEDVVVEDRSAPGATDIDIAMPNRCEEARRYGRRKVQVTRL